jgi:hypothetical protein
MRESDVFGTQNPQSTGSKMDRSKMDQLCIQKGFSQFFSSLHLDEIVRSRLVSLYGKFSENFEKRGEV